jgi:hypothetical protein
MEAPMRALRLAVLPLLVATSLLAQAPATRSDSAPAAAVAPRRSAFFDVAALVDNEQRFGLEPLVFGRWTIGLVGAHRGTRESQTFVPPTGVSPMIIPCVSPGCGSYPVSSGTSDWSLDLAVRYYPAILSISGPGHRLMFYVGEFIGYHQRTITGSYYAVPLGQVPAAGTTGSNPVMPWPITDRQRVNGWEPGAELGVRVSPLGPLFLDVGGWFKLVTIDDPTQSLRPGQVDARLVVAAGIGW